MIFETFLIGAFRRGKNLQFYWGQKKVLARENLHDIIVNGLATALLKNIMEVFNNVKEKHK